MMVFKNLFKPKWQHKDKDVRIAAIEKLDDPKILADIARNDESCMVRLAAVKKVENQNLLERIINYDDYFEVRVAALKKVEDPFLLSSAAKGDDNKDVVLTAIKRLKNPQDLADIAENALTHWARLAAVKRLNPKKWGEVLTRVAENDSEKEIRDLADKKLRERVEISNNEDELIEMAKHAKSHLDRANAVKKLDPDKNLDLLKRISLGEDPHFKVQLAAVKKISHEETLVEILMDDPQTDVAELVFKKISSQNSLADIAQHAKSVGNRNRAVTKLNPRENQQLFGEILLSEDDSSPKQTTMLHMNMDEIQDQKVVASQLKEYEYPFDPQYWESKYWKEHYDDHYNPIKKIVRKINDIDVLENLAQNAKDKEIQEFAKKRMTSIKRSG